MNKSATASVIFTMRYPDDTGYVWNTIAQSRDIAASYLYKTVNCFVAFPKLSGNPAYKARFMESIELDCYDYSADGLKKIADFIQKYDVRVIVFMSALPTSINLTALRRLGVRTLNTENDGFDHSRRDSLITRSIKFLVRRVLRRQSHDMHLANSKSQLKFLFDYAMIPRTRSALVRDGVDCIKFVPGNKIAARKSIGISTEGFLIIAVAQVRPEKRIDLIIKLAKKVIEQRSSKIIKFLFVGDGPKLIHYQKLVSDLGLADQFLFAGHQHDLLPFYQAANLMVHASIRESFGLAIVEAMSCGVPVVASAAAGPRETILDGKTGAVIEINDEESFLDAILNYVDNEALTSTHGISARSHVTANYSLDQHGHDVAMHIKALL